MRKKNLEASLPTSSNTSLKVIYWPRRVDICTGFPSLNMVASCTMITDKESGSCPSASTEAFSLLI